MDAVHKPGHTAQWVFAASLLVGGCRFHVGGLSDSSPTPDAAAGGDTDGAVAEPADFAAAAIPDSTALPGAIGDACNGQCANGLTCLDWVPAGYCTSACDQTHPCPNGSSCVDTTGSGIRYCLLNATGGSCMRPDLSCRDCGPSVCAPPSFCGGC